ncbi:unnamed protein product [Acanthosepion pharaonis]|uniref:Uncharacterized protein n=1 Tax=Acanthosepion pharaonis TaxID=158019 RepID=A0A812CG62_ACAPH|nr:unnamed protein product [Sepia pharaonis]
MQLNLLDYLSDQLFYFLYSFLSLSLTVFLTSSYPFASRQSLPVRVSPFSAISRLSILCNFASLQSLLVRIFPSIELSIFFQCHPEILFFIYLMFSPYPSILSASYSFLSPVYFSHFLRLFNSSCFSFSFFTYLPLYTFFSSILFFTLELPVFFFLLNNKIFGSLSLVPVSLITVSRKMAVIIFRLTWTLPTDKQIMASFFHFFLHYFLSLFFLKRIFPYFTISCTVLFLYLLLCSFSHSLRFILHLLCFDFIYIIFFLSSPDLLA